MFIRFQGAILLAVVTSIASTRIEHALLNQRRAIGEQYYEVDALRERVARLRLTVEQLGNLSTLAVPFEDGRLQPSVSSELDRAALPTTPLLRWRTTGAR